MATDQCAVRARTIFDVDGVAAAMADGLETECVQLESRPFVIQHVAVAAPDMPGMVVQFVREDVAVARRLRVPAGKWVFLVPLALSDTTRWNARRVTGNDLLVQAPGSECYAFEPAGTQFALISVAEGTDAAALGRVLTGHAGECTLVVRQADADALRRRLAQVRTPGPVAIGAALRRLADALEIALRHAMPSEQRVYLTAAYKRVVRRAEEFFRNHAGQRFSSGQLSSAVRVSERHLRNAFYDVYATSPMRYFRLWQLNQARRALRSTTHRASSVTDIAISHGFSELGRFAGNYKALFGESPSTTLGHRPSA